MIKLSYSNGLMNADIKYVETASLISIKFKVQASKNLLKLFF